MKIEEKLCFLFISFFSDNFFYVILFSIFFTPGYFSGTHERTVRIGVLTPLITHI